VGLYPKEETPRRRQNKTRKNRKQITSVIMKTSPIKQLCFIQFTSVVIGQRRPSSKLSMGYQFYAVAPMIIMANEI